MASNALKQLIIDAAWGELDYFVLDLPPGTSDIHLTLVQTLAITGAIVVTTPQEVALADARKGISMFTGDKVNVPILGLVENMSWFTPAELPENKYYLFGKDGGKRLAQETGVPLWDKYLLYKVSAKAVMQDTRGTRRYHYRISFQATCRSRRKSHRGAQCN